MLFYKESMADGSYLHGWLTEKVSAESEGVLAEWMAELCLVEEGEAPPEGEELQLDQVMGAVLVALLSAEEIQTRIRDLSEDEEFQPPVSLRRSPPGAGSSSTEKEARTLPEIIKELEEEKARLQEETHALRAQLEGIAESGLAPMHSFQSDMAAAGDRLRRILLGRHHREPLQEFWPLFRLLSANAESDEQRDWGPLLAESQATRNSLRAAAKEAAAAVSECLAVPKVQRRPGSPRGLP